MTSIDTGVTVEIGILGKFCSPKRMIAETTFLKRTINDLAYTKIYLSLRLDVSLLLKTSSEEGKVNFIVILFLV